MPVGGKGWPLSPTRLAPHSWRADPWSYILASPPLACQASKPPLAQGLLIGLPRKITVVLAKRLLGPQRNYNCLTCGHYGGGCYFRTPG